MSNKQSAEKYIEKNIKSIENIEKFFVEKKDKNSIDVVVVLSKIDKIISSKLLTLESKVNKDYKIPSNFKIFPTEAW